MNTDFYKALNAVRDRLRLNLLLLYGARGLAAGLIATAVVFVISKSTALPFDLIKTAISLIVTALSIGLIWGIAIPISIFDAAFACDTRLGLKERISSALEFHASNESNPLVSALIADASRHACRIRPERDFPLRLPRELIFALGFALFSFGLYFLPPWQKVFASDEKKEEYAEVQLRAGEVKNIAQEIKLNFPPEGAESANEIARDLQKLARDMELGILTKAEALKRLNQIDNKIEKIRLDSGYKDLDNRLKRMADTIKSNEELYQAAKALQNADTQTAKSNFEHLAEKLEKGEITSKDYQQLSQKLGQASKALKGNDKTQQLSDELGKASTELKSASDEAFISGITDPAFMAAELIKAIEAAIPEIARLPIQREIISKAIDELSRIQNKLKSRLDKDIVNSEDIEAAMADILKVQEMLDKAELDPDESKKIQEEFARELINAAVNLIKRAESINDIDPKVRSKVTAELQKIVNDLNKKLSDGAVSEESNNLALEQIEKSQEILEKAGMALDDARQLKKWAENLMREAASLPNIDREIREEAIDNLQDIADRLAEQIKNKTPTSQSNEEFAEQIDEIFDMLQNARPTEDVAKELRDEARQLAGTCSRRTDITEAQKKEMISTLEEIADKLDREISQKTASRESNNEASEKLDKIKSKLGSCSGNPLCGKGTKSLKRGKPGCKSSSMSALSGKCKGSSGSKSLSSSKAGKSQAIENACNALRSAAKSCKNLDKSLKSGQCFKKASKSLSSCRSKLGACQGGSAASGWGEGSTQYEGGRAPVSKEQWSSNTEDPTATDTGSTRYIPIYDSRLEPGSGFETQLHGKVSEDGDSLFFIRKIDPSTGEVSYVPYLSIEPSEISSLMDAIEDQDIPRSYREIVRFYFEQLTGKSPDE